MLVHLIGRFFFGAPIRQVRGAFLKSLETLFLLLAAFVADNQRHDLQLFGIKHRQKNGIRKIRVIGGPPDSTTSNLLHPNNSGC